MHHRLEWDSYQRAGRNPQSLSKLEALERNETRRPASRGEQDGLLSGLARSNIGGEGGGGRHLQDKRDFHHVMLLQWEHIVVDVNGKRRLRNGTSDNPVILHPAGSGTRPPWPLPDRRVP